MIILIDNYDSFAYNLYQMLGSCLIETGADPDIRVVRNDQATVAELTAMRPSHLVISPGPGKPEDAGICVDAVKAFAGVMPLLGVCLGHQAICLAYGAQVGHAARLRHGVGDLVHVDNRSPLFAGLPPTIQAARYHSLAVAEASLPPALRVTARADDEEVMAVQDATSAVFGVQFHPESILTPQGQQVIRNFLSIDR